MLDIISTPQFGQFVANVLLALVALIVPMVGAAVRGLLKSKAGNQTFETAYQIIRMAVLAAEQAGLNGVIENKKDYAIQVAQEMLADRGIKMDLLALSNAIEALVADELNRPVINEATYRKSLQQGAA